MRKQTALYVLIAVALAVAVTVGTVQLGYRPIREKSEALQKKTDALQTLYEAYQASDKNVRLWEQSLGAETADAKETLPAQVTQRELLDLIAALEPRFGFEAANIRFGTKKTIVSEADGIYSETLVFDYGAASMDAFGALLEAVRNNGAFPASVSHFTMKTEPDGSLRGDLYLQVYFAP